MSKLKYLDSLIESLDEQGLTEAARFKSGDRLVFNDASKKEIDSMKKSDDEFFGYSLKSATHYPLEQVYIFQNYYGSNARVYPEGGDDNIDSFSVNADRFELAPMGEMTESHPSLSDRDLVDAALEYVNDDSWHGAVMHINKNGRPEEWFDYKNTAYTIADLKQAKEIVKRLMPNEMNTTSSGGGEYATPNAFSKSKKSNKHYKPKEYTYNEKSIYENILQRIHEISYKDFKSNPDMTSKQKINVGIKEIAKQLHEMDRSLSRVIKLKTEIGADQSIFLKSTIRKFAKINERLLKLSNKLREFSK